MNIRPLISLEHATSSERVKSVSARSEVDECE
jgi:hypothetical protein